MADENDLQGRACKILYHLGKGLWKSIPVLGPLVEELVYEQFRDKFLGRIDSLPETELQKIVDMVPAGITPEELDKGLSNLSEDIRRFTAQQLSAVLLSLHEIHGQSQEVIDAIAEEAKRLPTIEQILTDIRDQIKDKQSLQLALHIIGQRRRNWVERISVNQVKLLRNIPDTYTPIADLWEKCNKLMPACAYKEFRFRLHELEWLGLVERYWRGWPAAAMWVYQRTNLGKERTEKND